MSNIKINIPKLTAKSDLHVRFLVLSLGGFWNVLGKEGADYVHLLLILNDKVVCEYNSLKKYLDKAKKTGDILRYQLYIIWHLENCINTLARTNKVIKRMKVSNLSAKSQSQVSQFIENAIKLTLENKKINDIRNRMEHIDEDISSGKIKGPIIPSIDFSSGLIDLNGEKLNLTELVILIDDWYSFSSSICNEMPEKFESGKYYYKNGPVE